MTVKKKNSGKGPEKETPKTPEPREQEEPAISLNDLGSALNLINVAIKRGAYEPNELTQVGSIYGKLETFIQWQAARQSEATPETEESKE